MSRYLILAVLLLRVLAGRAWADASSDAEDLVRQAVQLRREGKDQKALVLLREAYRLMRTPRTSSQLGLVEMALSHWVEADNHLAEGLFSHDSPWVDANRTTLEEARREIERHIARVTIAGAPEGSEVTANGQTVGTTPLAAPVLVAEGRVDLGVRASDGSRWSQTLVLQGASTTTVAAVMTSSGGKESVASGLPPSSSVNAPSSTPESRPVRRPLPWVAAVGSALFLAGAVYEAEKAGDDRTAFDTLRNQEGTIRVCGARDPSHGLDPRCGALYSSWQREQVFMFVGLGGAAALAVASGVLFWTRPAETSVQVGLKCDPQLTAVGVQCHLWF